MGQGSTEYHAETYLPTQAFHLVENYPTTINEEVNLWSLHSIFSCSAQNFAQSFAQYYAIAISFCSSKNVFIGSFAVNMY